MSKKVVNLETSRSRFFRQYLELVKSFHPYRSLRPKELDVLAFLYYYNDKYKELEPEIRWKVIMEYGTKEEIKEKCGDMTTANFNNILTSFRKKGIMVNNRVPDKFLLEVDEEFSFSINFKIDGTD